MAVVVEGEELLAVELPLAAQGLQVLLDKVMLAVVTADLPQDRTRLVVVAEPAVLVIMLPEALPAEQAELD
jgi:hypothetical protein